MKITNRDFLKGIFILLAAYAAGALLLIGLPFLLLLGLTR